MASRLMVDRIADAYTRAIHEHARGRLLDLGCGHVPLFGAYQKLVDTITCADWPQTLHSSPHLDAEVDLNSDLPWGSSTYDTVLLTDVLEHLPYPDRLWQELRRIVCPSGKVILGVPFMYWLHEEPHDYHRYTEHRLRRFCDDHGFEVIELSSYGGATDTAADVLARLLDCRRRTSWTVSPLLAVATQIGKRRVGTRDPLPLGYLLVCQRDELAHR